MDTELSIEDFKANYKNNFTFKCKIDTGKSCSESKQCPFNNVCKDGKCIGLEKAFCVNDSHCDSALKCN